MEHHCGFISVFGEMSFKAYKNLSFLVTSQGHLSRLQDLKLHEREKVVSFQWLGPQFSAFLKYATTLLQLSDKSYNGLCDLRDLLKRLDDSASDCIVYGETEHYKNFLQIIHSFMPKIRKFFTIQNLLQLFDRDPTRFPVCFIDFLFETIGELLNCRMYSSVLVSNQAIVLLKELKFLLTFLVDTTQRKEERNKNILTEIDAVFSEAGLFLHSFFFTTNLVTMTTMDLAISVLLERIEIVRKEIKVHCVAVSMKLNSGIGSLQVAESPSEVSSSQDKSNHTVEEMTVGFKDMTTQIKSKLLGGPKNRQIISIVGMPGLGKTTLAKKLYNDTNVRQHFDVRSWCVVSQTFKKRKLLIDILSSVSNLNGDQISEMEDEDLAERLYQTLIGRRYLIVMDDLWDIHAWDDLKWYFPDDNINGSRLLFTSRLKNVALETSHVIIEPPLLSPDESWNLLKQKVFKNEGCPQELQVIGIQIATNCHGLPLSVILVAGFLSNMEKEKSLWQQIASRLSSYISQKADDYIPSLELSYVHLPDHLKSCFLYLSAFQEDEEIPVQKLLLLWIAEGFIEKKEQKSLEDVAEEYLMELIDRSLLQVAKKSSDNGKKACTVHDLVLKMCCKIAVEDEIFLFQHQFLISKHRHRLCMDRSHHLSKALSILYNSEETRILDSAYDRIVQLGIKIMPDLRYLEVSSLEPSIGRLQNLEVLIVKANHNLIPAYVLNLPKLRHLYVENPLVSARLSEKCDRSRINSLQTLQNIYFLDSQDVEILRCSPNLRTLICKFSGSCYPDLSFLARLETLEIGYESRIIWDRFKGDYSMVNFSESMRKLTLRGISLPWEKISLIGTLPNLEILKLQKNAFKGKIWDTEDDEFQNLKFLELHELDLEQWNSSYNHFPVLERLVLESCLYLEKIPSEFGNIPTLCKIEVYFCEKNVENSALDICAEQEDNGNEEFDVIIESCW